jgi:hypothetical protein
MSIRVWWSCAVFAGLLGIAGCQDGPRASAVTVMTDVDAGGAAAQARGCPLVVLVVDPERGPDDAAATEQMRAGLAHAGVPAIAVVLDLGDSRNRAIATRYHLVEAPILVALSAHGVQAARSVGPVTADAVRAMASATAAQGPGLDAQFAVLQAATTAPGAGAAADQALADFLTGHGNEREAVPILAALRTATDATPAQRRAALVAEVRAHFWIGEPEKARHLAQAFIAAAGATDPEDRAAGLYALGSYEATGRHRDLGLGELDQAIAAAPASMYGQLARAERARYP